MFTSFLLSYLDSPIRDGSALQNLEKWCPASRLFQFYHQVAMENMEKSQNQGDFLEHSKNVLTV